MRADKLDTAMTLNIDTSAALRSPQSRAALVEAIRQASSLAQETHWLEWKSSLDFDTTAHRFAAARAIIAFANRHPETAARDCDGEAYLVVGAKPGQVVGVEVLDAAVIHDKLRPFVDGPHWTVDYVEAEGKSVLVITVAPPQPGDRIHSLVNTYQGNRSGTVFHRGVASSAPATHRELGMLQDRLLQTPPESADEQFMAAVGGTNPVVVDQLTRNAVNAALTAYADPEQFPATFDSRTPKDQLKQYIVIARRYHDATTGVLDRIITGCRWENSAHERIWTGAITALAEPRPLNQTVRSRQPNPAGGQALIMTARNERLEALSLLPATLTMYAGVIAAVEGQNFGAVRALTTDGRVSRSVFHPDPKVTVIEKVGPWEAVASDERSMLALRAAQQTAANDEALDEQLTAIANGNVRRPRFVASAYLFDALRPHFADHTEARYRELFDQAETLLSLIVADQMAQHRPFVEPWLRLFVDTVADSPSLDRSMPGMYLAEAIAAGADWPPLQAGMFGGSPDRVKAAAQLVRQYTDQTSRRGPFA